MSQRSCMKETLLLGLSFLLGLCSYEKQGAMAQAPGFVSIDCGSTSNGNYTESQIVWTLDGNLTQGEGKVYAVQGPDGDVSKRYTTIRYFPAGNQTKYCYSLSGVTKGSFYLVRASFWPGRFAPTVYTRNYVAFTLLVNADVWVPINISLPQYTPFVEEAYVQAISISSVMSVCLSSLLVASSQAGDPPFISSLELRPLSLNIDPVTNMIQTQRALRLTAREAYGNYSTRRVIRYPDDSFDRIWTTTSNALPSLSTSVKLNNTINDLPPEVVMQNTYVSNWATGFSLNYTGSLYGIQSSSSYFYALYFSEIDPNVTSAGLRVFNVTLNGEYEFTVNGPDPSYDIALYGMLEVYETGPYTAMVDYLLFNFTPTSTSIYLPIISGIEVLQYFDYPWSYGTFDDDVVAMDDFTSSFNNLSSYKGDPCLPSAYKFPWLSCSSDTSPRITALSLSNFGLVGELPESINDLRGLIKILIDGNNLDGQLPYMGALKSLQVLDLSNNHLSGPIPAFLSTLQNLKNLSLQNNNFSGLIPTSLLNSAIVFEYGGNPFLCTTANATCKNEASQSESHSIGLIVWLVIGGLLIVILVLGAIGYAVRKRKRTNVASTAMPIVGGVEEEHAARRTQLVEASNVAQVFSFQDIIIATEDFSHKLGQGGFGPVYQGQHARGGLLAIKVLSDISTQGEREFLNEVGLLSRVHHKNLTRLLGYCTEKKLVLAYEYMSKGSLFHLLYDEQALETPLTWRQRLSILVDAAQGLEYLHHGCSPRIIHRDVKSSNILLNHKMEAKIADFGISRLTMNDNDSFATSLQGSMGYLDPQYISTMRLTEKIDIYSFGVLLFEVLCGRRPRSHGIPIVEWVRPYIERGEVREIMDPKCGDGCNVSSVWQVVEIGMVCVEFDGSKRPSMSEVCAGLKEALRLEAQGDQFTQTPPETDLLNASLFFSLTRVQTR